MAGEFTPLNEINHPDAETRVNLGLPEFLAARIGIDVARLETLCRIIGVMDLTISTFKNDEDDSVGVGSVDAHGQATATTAPAKRKTLNNARSQHAHKTPLDESEKYTGIISLNTQQILKIISESSDLGLRDFEKIADLLDQELKKAMVKLAYNCGIVNKKVGAKINTYGSIIGIIYSIFGDNIPLTLNLLAHLFLNLSFALRAKKNGNYFRPGLGVASMEIDRFIWCAIRAHTGRLVGTVMNEKNPSNHVAI